MRKALVIALICWLTLYAPIELSRLIIEYGLEFGTTAELCSIWVFYLIAIAVLIKVVKV